MAKIATTVNSKTSVKKGLMWKIKNWFVTLPRSFKRHWIIYLMILPFVVHTLIFHYWPMRYLEMAWQRFSPFLGIANSPSVGWDNFYQLLFGRASAMFLRAVRNTVVLSLWGLAIGFPIPIIIAIMYHELRMGKFRAISQSILLLPRFFSEVIVVGIAVAFLRPRTGIINIVLIRLGVINEGIDFILRSEFFRGIFIFLGSWQNAAFSSLIFLAALTSISKELYESAALDGASRLRRIWHISLPGVRDIAAIMFVLAVGQLFGTNLERALLLQEPITYETSDVIATFMWRSAFTQFPPNFSLAAALGLMNGFVAFVLVFGSNMIKNKISGNEGSSLF